MAIRLPYVVGIERVEDLIQSLILKISGNRSVQIKNIASLSDVSDDSLVFCSKPGVNIAEIMRSVRGCIVLIGRDIEPVLNDDNLWVTVTNPRLAFCMLVGKPDRKPRIHPSAIINSDAKIGSGANIGALSVIGKVTIGKDVTIGNSVIIEDGVTIGDRVSIKSGSIIGTSGFGFEKDSDGVYHEFYHWGGVVIEDDVQIGSNCCVDRGALGNTIIKSGVKTDNFVHIAHNCIVGKNSILTAMTELSGSVKVGENVWFAPSSSVINGVSVGDNAFLGIGSICTTNIEAGHRLIPSFSTVKPPKNETR